MFTLRNVTFRHGRQTPIFDGFSWHASRGERWAVLGPSGCGKTTLLTLLAGLQMPTDGQVMVDSQPLTRPRPQTGLILQDYGLLPWASVRENVDLGLKVRHFYGQDGRHTPEGWSPVQTVNSWLERLGLAAVAGQYPAQLSGGQRQRTAIARTLILQPDLLLMDEPFSSLDALTREDLQSLTLELCAEHHLTLVLVTHAIEEAVAVGSRILLLGQPPNRQPRLLENPGAGQPGFRASAIYQAMCQAIRTELSHETA